MSPKGGVGKTTSTMLVAAALVAVGESVSVVDTDPQASALMWAEFVAKAGPPLPFEVISGGADFAKRVRTQTDWVLLDTPPGNEVIIREAIRWADLVVLPTRPGALDLLQLNPALEAAQGTPAAVLLVQVRSGVKETGETLEALRDVGAVVLDAQIPMRARTARLALVRPSVRDLESSRYQAVANEIREALT